MIYYGKTYLPTKVVYVNSETSFSIASLYK